MANEAHQFHIPGEWIIHEGLHGVEPMRRVCAALGGGQLQHREGVGNGRTWDASWGSQEGASLTLSVHPYSCTDAQQYDFLLTIPGGTRVAFELVDACTTTRIDFFVRGGPHPPARVEAEIRAAFADFAG